MPRRASRIVLMLAVVVALAGCAAPPVTTAERPDGSVVTLEWADYPGHAYVDADDILGTPDIDEIEQHAASLMAAIRTEVAEATGIDLQPLGDGGRWDRFSTNGYSHPSLLTSYSCCSLAADVVPDDFDDWMRIRAIVARVSEDFGAGPLVLEQDQEGMGEDAVRSFAADWGTGVPGEYSLLSARTTGSGQSLMLMIEDPARRLEASDVERENPPYIRVDYSATVIERGKRAEFEARLAPYAGHDKPDSTEWD